MNLPEPQTRTFNSIVNDIDSGQIKIPQFQRDFVWTLQQSASLLDSIIKGYPIGAFILWRTRDRLRSVRELGNQIFPDPDPGEAVDYILDGQQRLTSLYSSLKGLSIQRPGSRRHDDFSEIYIDLEAEKHDQIVRMDLGGGDPEALIKVVTLLENDFQVLGGYKPKYHERIKRYQNSIENFQYSVILLRDAPIDIATEVFTRLNVGGEPLSLFEIMVAKTYDDQRQFDLADAYEELVSRLQQVEYETIPSATVLQSIALIISGDCRRQAILQLDKQTFIDTWPQVVDAIERAVDHFRGAYRIPVSQLLPYKALIAPFAYFFFHHPDKPQAQQHRYLQDFFWRCALGGRYSSAVESKLAQDVKRIAAILEDKQPEYEFGIDTSPEFIIKHGTFSANRSYSKAILCLYAFWQPKSFNDNSIVNIGNQWLKRVNSKNYHHFFPRSYLAKQNYEEWYANHILNITIVDDYLNKRQIGAKPPAKYMKDFKEVNAQLTETMKTHLIDDLERFGIWDDDYNQFIAERAQRVSMELRERLIDRSIDEEGQVEVAEDYEEELAAYE